MREEVSEKGRKQREEESEKGRIWEGEKGRKQAPVILLTTLLFKSLCVREREIYCVCVRVCVCVCVWVYGCVYACDYQ